VIKLFLVQHGDAVPDEVDTTRPLSERGPRRRSAPASSSKNSRLSELILHSGKKRAEQTAEIISYALGGVKMEKRPFLNPKDGIEGILEEIARFKVSVMIVGTCRFSAGLPRSWSAVMNRRRSSISTTLRRLSSSVLKKAISLIPT
jgi:phosphohistidine phosphatase